jgi:hypothetical protein
MLTLYSNRINKKTYTCIINTSEGYNRVMCFVEQSKRQTCAVTVRLHGEQL